MCTTKVRIDPQFACVCVCLCLCVCVYMCKYICLHVSGTHLQYIIGQWTFLINMYAVSLETGHPTLHPSPTVDRDDVTLDDITMRLCSACVIDSVA